MKNTKKRSHKIRSIAELVFDYMADRQMPIGTAIDFIDQNLPKELKLKVIDAIVEALRNTLTANELTELNKARASHYWR